MARYIRVLLIILALCLIFWFVSLEDDFKKPNFGVAVDFVLKWEGGYVNDPNDLGGETKYGISSRAYPYLDIKNLTIEDAKKIYYEDYWLKAGCDELAPPFDIIIFDTAVNMGRGMANKLLDECSGWEDYLLRRLYTYSKFKQAPRYFRGWANRVLSLWKMLEKANITKIAITPQKGIKLWFHLFCL